jgi:asparagine synthase (glutamine-hydrolysing)
MCGIAGIFAYGTSAPAVFSGELLAIREAMGSRGPDGAGLWTSSGGRVALAHRRLSLLDLSEAGAQPMANEDGSLQIVFNGEIYNYRELRRELESKGFRFRSSADTEVLLHLYADKGKAMLGALRGMYAFAIWDDRNQRIFAARDPLGIKPLYYADDGKTLRFASQVKALLVGRGISSERDPAGEVGFLLLGYVPEPFTTYRAIKALPAGACLVTECTTGLSIRDFCRIENELGAAENDNGGSPRPEVTRLRLHEAISDSVLRHLVADVPVGVFLSAGLDSSVVTALASESPLARLRTITLGFNEYHGGENDETVLAAVVARRYATQHETRWITRDEFRQELDGVITAMDQPSIDGVNTYFVAKAAHEAGLKAALSGIGGDELFGGYPSFRQVPRMGGVFGRLVPRHLGKALRIVSVPVLKSFTSTKYAGLFEYGQNYGGAYLLRRALFMPWEIPHILQPEVAREGWERLQIERHLQKTVSAIGCPQLKVAALEIAWYMRNQLLRDSDWAGMANSVEIRTPLADIEVLRVVASIAAHGWLRSSKRDLAELPSKPLPRQIVERRKTGFTVPVREWVSQIGTASEERGLRGWARFLAREFDFHLGKVPRQTVPSQLPTDVV